MPTYAELSRGNPPSLLVERAAALCPVHGHALDLGAGSLRNTKYLLDKGFEVVAVDKDTLTKSEGETLSNPRLKVVSSSFADFDFPEAFYDLVIAINSLPFEVPAAYSAVFERVKKSLKPSGILAMTFFGPRDEWARTSPAMTFHSRADIQALCKDLQIEALEEVEEDGTTIQKVPKHWHFFRLIARKA